MDSTLTMDRIGSRRPRTRAALDFARERHHGQRRESDGAPFVTHPLEVAEMLEGCGYRDEVVAAGVLHDVLEDTDARPDEIEQRFGRDVAGLVASLTDDPSIEDPAERKAALRLQVAQAGEEAGAIFAADKVSKARELRLQASRGPLPPEAGLRLEHYEESLEMLRELIPEHSLLRDLELELEAIRSL